MVLPLKGPSGPITFTKFIASDSATLTKTFTLTPENEITKSGQPNFAYGSAETLTIENLTDLPLILDGLSRNECISTGVFNVSSCLIVPKGSTAKPGEIKSVRYRAKKNMKPHSPGLLMFDHDGNVYMPKSLVCNSIQELVQKLATAIPEFATVGYVGSGSSSHGVYVQATGEAYPSAGLHLYIVFESPDYALLQEYLEVKLWNAGYGYIALASNGARLKRTIIDLSVFSPERLIYEASPILGIGLARHDRTWTTREGPALSRSLHVTPEERESCQRKIAEAMADIRLVEQSDNAYQTYRSNKVSELAQVKGITLDEANNLMPVLSPEDRERQTRTLTCDDIVEINGKKMTVAEVLSHGKELDGMAMSDPVEGSAYGSSTAKFYFNDGRNPCIHSFAHGQKTVYLLPPVSAFSKVVPVSGQLVPKKPEPLEPSSFPHYRVTATRKIKPIATIEVVAFLLDSYGIVVRYNEISKKLSIMVPGASGSPDNALNVAMNTIMSLAALNGIPTGQVPNFVATIADRNRVNEVADWIRSLPWDGRDRIPDMVATLTTPEDFPGILKYALIYRWLLSAVAAALLPSGFFARGVLTLQGPQGIGKTSWIRALITLPMLRDTVILLGHHLDVGNKDSILTAISHWVVELGELDSSFRKDIARLKGFTTGASDKVRRPYAMTDSEYQRRTAFCATVNDHHFLVDTTGNTRWWTVPVTAINYAHGIDMQQVFAQLAVDLENGAQWWLTQEEEVLLAEHNRQHRAVNVIEEKLLGELDWELPDEKWRYLSAGDVLEKIGYVKPSNPQCRECGAVLRELFGDPKRINGIMKWRVPLAEDSFPGFARRR